VVPSSASLAEAVVAASTVPEPQRIKDSMTAAAGLSRIGQIAMNAHDLDRAIRFYSDALGLPFLFRAPPQLAFFDCGGVRLLLDVPEDKEFAHPGSVLYFAVDDIQQMHQLLLSRGVRFRQGPHLVAKLPDREVWMAFFDDTEGNVLALMSERPV
jgi:methylmalonyl-CoA/ethylmalonyl-CoA epimerase